MRPRIITQPDLTSTAYMGHDLGAAFHLAFTVRVQRELFEAQPPDKQRETMERVRDLVSRYPSGWLAKHWTQIYRLRGEG